MGAALAAFGVTIACGTTVLTTQCSNNTLGPSNGSTCQVNSDCASNCCLSGGYPNDPSAPAKVCTEPAGCYEQDGSMSSEDSGSDSASPVESGAVDTGSPVDSGSPGDSSAPKDSASPVDSSAGG